MEYWSNSKFADVIRGTPKIKMGTSQQWYNWEKTAKQAHPIRFWIAEELLDFIQNFVQYPIIKLNEVRYYIMNRWISHTHRLTAHPSDIKPGTWIDVGDRFLPCMFNELVDFVEIETPAMSGLFNRSNWLFRRSDRHPEIGVAHLEWATKLKIDYVEETHPDYGKPTHQAIAAQEIIDLYNWWKTVYRNRPDPYDVYLGSDFVGTEPPDSIAMRTLFSSVNELEMKQQQEDEEMMIRLIKVRGSLWT